MRSFKRFFEKTVIGLIEVMDIEGIGNVEVKVDSGNSAMNVLTSQDETRQGNKVIFTTVNGKRLIKDIKDTININIGSGHVEERIITTFKIKFGGVEFDNVPFSLANRESNEYKVLMGKEFIKELDALIDVNAKNIANKQISVDV